MIQCNSYAAFMRAKYSYFLTTTESMAKISKLLCELNIDVVFCFVLTKKVSEYDQEIPQSQTADNPVA